MNRLASIALAIFSIFLLTTVASAATVNVKITIVNETGAKIGDALALLSPVDDPQQQVTIDENEMGDYEDTLELASGAAEWTVHKIVVDGYLPVRVSIKSFGPEGDAIQEVDAMTLDPGIPIPPLKLAAQGRVEIDLTMGDRQMVMDRFRSARAAVRAQAEKEQAEKLAAAEEIKDYATALKLHKEGDVEGSLPYFRKAIEQKPDDKALLVLFARVLYQAQRMDEFKTAANRALDLDPRNTELLMMLYTSQRAAGDLKANFALLMRIKEAGGNSADLLPHLIFVAQSMEQNKQAVPVYEAILELNPKDSDSCVALAFIFAASGDSPLSEKYLARAIDLKPDEAASLYHSMGAKLLASKDSGEAEFSRASELFNKTLEHDPSFVAAYKSLGLASWKTKDYAGARLAFEKYLERQPQAPDAGTIQEYLNQLPE